MVKSQLLKLLTRLVLKLRFILRTELESKRAEKKDVDKEFDRVSHLSSLNISESFLNKLLSDMEGVKREDDKTANAEDCTASLRLYSAFLQDCVEFLMTIVVPVDR